MAEELAIKISALDNFSKMFDKVEKKLDRIGSRMAAVGKSLTTYVSLPILGVGLAGLKAAANFEQGMANVRSVTMASRADMRLMEQAALVMAGRYKGSAKDAADALYYIASAGYSAKDSASALQGVMSLASATNSDLAYTSENVMAAISMFGLKASETTRIADVYAKACQISQAEMSKLADSMRYAGPIAKTLGWSFEQTTAVLSRLYDAGFKGEQAGTILRGALSKLVDPSKEASEALDAMGISSNELAKAIQNPADLIDLFRSRSITAQQAVAIFGQEAGPGMMTLLEKGGDAIRDYEGKLNSAAGTADKAAKIQLDTLQGKLEKIKDAFEKLSISISKNHGILDTLALYLDKAAQSADRLTPAQQQLIVQVLLAAAAFGPLVTIIGKAIEVVLWLQSAISSFLASPLAMAAVLVAAVVALGVFYDKMSLTWQILVGIISPWSMVISKAIELKNRIDDLGGIGNTLGRASDAASSFADRITDRFPTAAVQVRAIAGAFEWLADVMGRSAAQANSTSATIAQAAARAANAATTGRLGPGFQLGGTIPGPAAKPVRAMVHGGETVVPNNPTKTFFQAMGLPTQQASPISSVIHNHIYLDGKQVAESVDYHNAGVSANL